MIQESDFCANGLRLSLAVLGLLWKSLAGLVGRHYKNWLLALAR